MQRKTTVHILLRLKRYETPPGEYFVRLQREIGRKVRGLPEAPSPSRTPVGEKMPPFRGAVG